MTAPARGSSLHPLPSPAPAGPAVARAHYGQPGRRARARGQARGILGHLPHQGIRATPHDEITLPRP
jgi:hypothetical protein